MKSPYLFLLVCILCLTACSANPVGSPVDIAVTPGNTPTVQPALPTDEPTKTATEPTRPWATIVATEPQPTQPTPTETESPTPTLSPDGWKTLPVVPVVPPKVKDIYLRGLALGNNPHAFSKIGDCGSTPSWFLGDFDRGPTFYSLGEYTNLEPVIQEFQGSYARTSLAAKSGFNVSSILSPFWADGTQCLPNETPLACEVRVHKPMLAFVMLGTNDVYHLDSFEPGMRKLIEYLIENGIIPILSTKADNLEGNEVVNATIARLALEYEVPLLNYWQALQALPDQGLQPDKAHITYGSNRFDDPRMLETGWTVRNLTSLQALDRVWRAVKSQP